MNSMSNKSAKNGISPYQIPGWPHFWETKCPEFSLRFPEHFKIFPWATDASPNIFLHLTNKYDIRCEEDQ